MFPYVPNFNPQKQKPAISVCGPRQLIVNSRRSSQNMKMAGAGFYHTKEVNYIYLNDNFMENIFFKIQANTQQMLCEKFENLICIIKWAVATYVKVNKNRPDLSV